MREKIFNWLEDYWVYLIFVFWISGLSIILIAFQGMGWFYLAALSLLFYWTPYGCSICHKSHYVSADNCDMSNPLYVRGFFRKNSNKKRILSGLKGFFYCQSASLILLINMFLYRFMIYFFDYRNDVWESISVFLSACLFVLWLIIRNKYIWYYLNDIYYPKNKDGIWIPFRYIASQPYGLYGTELDRFYKRFYGVYDEMKNKINTIAIQKGYAVLAKYSENKKEMLFYARKKKDCVQIFEIIHIEKYSDEELEYFNNKFVEFWKGYIQQKWERQSVEFTFLLCVDEETKELKKFLDTCCGRLKKNRCILPVFMVRDFYGEYYSVSIESVEVGKKYKKKYNMMRKELIEILDIDLKDLKE